MNSTLLSVYQDRHPNAILMASEFPDCAAALNALFGRDMWELESEILDMPDEEVDISSDAALKNFQAPPVRGSVGVSSFLANPRAEARERLRWRAPVETLNGPSSLWKESHELKPDLDTLNAMRAALSQPPAEGR